MQLRIPAWSVITVTDVIASRAFDGTVYTNTTGKTVFANITIECLTVNAGEFSYGYVTVNGVNQGSFGITVGVAGLKIKGMMTVAIKSGATYSLSKAVNGAATAVLSNWLESV